MIHSSFIGKRSPDGSITYRSRTTGRTYRIVPATTCLHGLPAQYDQRKGPAHFLYLDDKLIDNRARSFSECIGLMQIEDRCG